MSKFPLGQGHNTEWHTKKEKASNFSIISRWKTKTVLFFSPFTTDLTLVSHVPARNKAVILLSSQRHDNNVCVHGWGISHKPEITMHNYATRSGCNVLDELVRECTCIGSTMIWTLKLFFSLIAVACVNAFTLWMLKYPNWQQRKNYCKNMYLLSLGAEMVWPRTWKKADSRNVNRHTAGH
jgi:hypothetical protein